MPPCHCPPTKGNKGNKGNGKSGRPTLPCLCALSEALFHWHRPHPQGPTRPPAPVTFQVPAKEQVQGQVFCLPCLPRLPRLPRSAAWHQISRPPPPNVEDWQATERLSFHSLTDHVSELEDVQVQSDLLRDHVKRDATCPKANGPGWLFNGCWSSGWNRLQSFIIGGALVLHVLAG